MKLFPEVKSILCRVFGEKESVMKRKTVIQILIVTFLSINMLLGGCGSDTPDMPNKNYTDDKDDSQGNSITKPDADVEIAKPDEMAQKEQEKQVLLVYMVGSNLESQNALGSMDIVEMVESGYNADNLTVLLCTGGSSYWWLDGIPTDKCMVYEVSPQNSGQLLDSGSLSSNNMSDPKVLTEFIDYGCSKYPADSYSLILWNHGGGAVLGYGADENYDYAGISIGDLDNAINNTQLCKNGNKFEWIGFDACLMGMIEVGTVLSDNCNYMIASEEVEAGEGWDYGFLQTMSAQVSADGLETAEDIIDAYANFYEYEAAYAADYTLSCLDLSKTGEVVNALDEFSGKAKNDLEKGQYSRLAKARNEVKTFGKLAEVGFYDTIDLYDLAGKMERLYPAEADKLKKSVDEMVVYSKTNMQDAYGVAIYFPYENKDYAKEWLLEYENIGFSENYVSFVRSFEATLSGENLSEWDIQELEPEESQEAGKYALQLPDDLFQNYAKASYSVWEEDSEGTYICWIKSGDVTLTEDGMLGTDFDGSRFFLTGSNGNNLACCAIEIERTTEYAKYVIPIMYATKEEPLMMKSAYIHYKVNNQTKEGSIAGIYNSMDTSVTLFPDKTLVKIEDGYIVTPFLFARDIVFLEDGSVAPFDTWEAASGLGASFTVSGDFGIEIKPLEKETEYCCLFQVTDTQGNYSYTNPIYIKE